MAIVYLIALLLAWPTYGLSLLVVLVFAVARGYIRGKAGRVRDAYLSAEQEAVEAIQQGKVMVPTGLHNAVYQKQLVTETTKAAQDAGMTSSQVKSWFSQEDVTNAILIAAACFEKHGFNKTEQIVGASDVTKKLAHQQLQHENAKALLPQAESKPTTSIVGAANIDAGYEDGHRLFEAGMALAASYKSQEAIDYYTRSIDACKNPAPYINRANLLSKRIRHYEALQDLLEAQRLDSAQGKEFSTPIDHELKKVHELTQNYRNGVRETLVKPSESQNPRGIAEAILQNAFGIRPVAWDHNAFDLQFIEFHFFNEIDNIVKFEEVAKYPEVEEWLAAYSNDFILMKADSCPDIKAYTLMEAHLHTHLCSYEENEMRILRRNMLYSIHCMLMIRDFGGFWDALDSDCRGVTKEAEEFLTNIAR